jgi:hypothetical protein
MEMIGQRYSGRQQVLNCPDDIEARHVLPAIPLLADQQNT